MNTTVYLQVADSNPASGDRHSTCNQAILRGGLLLFSVSCPAGLEIRNQGVRRGVPAGFNQIFKEQ
ncbi:MAG: hypothetical protein B7Y56_08915 [Gallionellales bacterium 35-53-114]|nr:MAG: hypothetical protein B7Y56_08915 [Gallionellales bacterium 35-53-114]OYZ62743.1 MAG: hypothetical protein B7Y04_12770 [Gallionellales bacterium 24-53-125]OZB09819.1 MAG: hypothetical protein B7X61_04670 [Gallionellales bacterium 39-52-133]